MPRIISPPRSEHHKLRQPLQPGEIQVFELFDRCLPEEWEIYVQPHLNGLRPDFVLLHPRKGIAVFEVKDWNLDAVDWWMEARHGQAPVLKGRKNGTVFTPDENPVEKVHRYKQDILDLYCPRLDIKAGRAVITAGLCFPCADDERVADLLASSREYHGMHKHLDYYPLSGRRALESGDIHRVFPEAFRDPSHQMTPELAADLRAWLVEPDASASQRAPLELDAVQRKYALGPAVSRFLKIKGPAGSGKSVVLAARAAELVSRGREVLVITFNITLLNYLADLAVRHHPRARKEATWLNFHAWCKRVCLQADREADYLDRWRSSPRIQDDGCEGPPNAALCALVNEILDGDVGGRIPRYDAVLVDEGQDMLPEWWAVLRRACRPKGEMMVVADATQDIYGTARSGTGRAMDAAGFSDDWVRLPISYRLPPDVIEHAREFARRFLPRDAELPVPEQTELALYPCLLRWVQAAPEHATAAADREVRSLMSADGASGLSVSDVTLLVGNQAAGAEVVDSLLARGIRCIHTFGAQTEGRRKKLAFFMGDARVKVTTVHSFKGWEARAVVVRIDRAATDRGLALLYTALTRVRRHPAGSFLTVVCSDESMAHYGRNWPDFARM